MNRTILGMIRAEASHTLDFCINQTKMKLCSFHRCFPTEFLPMFSNGLLIEFGNLTNGEVKTLNPFVGLACAQKRSRENDLRGMKFRHGNSGWAISKRMDKLRIVPNGTAA